MDYHALTATDDGSVVVAVRTERSIAIVKAPATGEVSFVAALSKGKGLTDRCPVFTRGALRVGEVNAMRKLMPWIGLLLLMFSGGGTTVRGEALPDSAAPLPEPAPVVPQVISVGEQVTGTLHPTTCSATGCIPGVFDMLFELTAPSDGTLIVELDWNLDYGSLGLEVENGVVHYWPITVGTLPVTAGQTYRIWVYTNSWDLYGEIPFVLTTSITSGPLDLPPFCSMAPPARDWICIGEGWVPPDHPLAEGSAAPPPPPSGDAAGCLSIKPASDWVCVNGGWVPSDHPLALSSPASPTPLPPPPAPPPTGCTTPDPFAGIPGLIGVCIVNNGWVPIGHPLAAGGGG
jgi:hypothetical protein